MDISFIIPILLIPQEENRSRLIAHRSGHFLSLHPLIVEQTRSKAERHEQIFKHNTSS